MRGTRIRIDSDGSMEVVDPGFDSLELLRTIDPGFQIRWSQLPVFSSPRFLQTMRAGCGVERRKLGEMPEGELWDIHTNGAGQMRVDDSVPIQSGSEASLLDLKIELSHRMLTSCGLCAHGCGVDRTQGQLGICGLGTEAMVAGHLVHIAEEPPINPSLLISLYGCGLRCRYCQQWDLLDTGKADGSQLEASLWDDLDVEGARSMSFIGGNPDESLHSILRFLASAPPGWTLPVVWNCHGYGTPETVHLLDGVVDAYVPDMKYGDERCGRELSYAPGYPAAATAAIGAMLTQDVPVIVRILVLPGHFQCCHSPVLDFLSSINRANLSVSVRGQYCPDWRITSQDGKMARRPYPVEVEQVRQKALSLGLSLI